ncbi:MAG: HEAT repeat domain-containing protein [Phototrophicaceae bacterium]
MNDYDDFDMSEDMTSERTYDSVDDFDEDAYVQHLLDMERALEADPIIDADEFAARGVGALPDEKPGLDAVREALTTEPGPRPDPTIIYGVSGLSREQVDQLRSTWEQVVPAARRKIMRQLVEASENMFQLDYRAFAIFGLGDPDPGVREAAIDALWEDQSLEVMNLLIGIVRQDDNREVRAAAMSGLSEFILLGELGDLPDTETQRAQDLAAAVWQDEAEDVAVRRRALEAIANCSNPMVPGAIEDAYNSPHQEMRISAIFAMGRTYDDRWSDTVLEEIESEDPAMRYEAARAAGELSLVEAVPSLAQLTLEPDREIVEVAVWSLGEIGGKSAVRVLEVLAEKAEEEDDDLLLQAIDDALGNATLVSELDEL